MPCSSAKASGSQAIKLKLSKIIIGARCGSSEAFSYVKKRCSDDTNFFKKIRKF
jgi:hypothetical protein